MGSGGHNFKDESGKTYGRLKVQRLHGTDKHRQAQWDCICMGVNGVPCGNHIYPIGRDLRRGHTTSCRSCATAASALALVGTKVGNLTAKVYHAGTHDTNAVLDCLCTCGKSCTVTPAAFRKGISCPDCARRAKETARARLKAEKIAEHKAAVAARMVHGEADCHVCGKHFEYTMPKGTLAALEDLDRNRYCSKACRRKNRRVARRHQYRAKGAEVKVINLVDMFRIFDRDGWKCTSCGKATPRERYGKSLPDSPECDHQKALMIGGSNTEDNVHLLCHSCQEEKLRDFDLPWAAVYDYFGLWKVNPAVFSSRKLSPEQVLHMRVLYAGGARKGGRSAESLARQFGISKKCAEKACTGESYRHIPMPA